MYQLFSNIELVKKKWDQPESSVFVQFDFLESFFVHHNNFKHLFLLKDNTRLYAQVFQFRVDNIKHYSSNKLVFFLLKLLRLETLYLSNSFFTNSTSVYCQDKIFLPELISSIEDKYFMTVIPDSLMDVVSDDHKSNYERVEVEEDMSLEVDSAWNCLDDYLENLRTKYRKKIKNILKISDRLVIRPLGVSQLTSYKSEIQHLFNQVVQDSRFRGPDFNTDTLITMLEKDFLNVYGYFLDDKLEGFATEMQHEDLLYSYYVGFNKRLNKSFAIYGRILVETIRNAIKFKKKKIIFGRTANEFKSNFGAVPNKSYIYIRITNQFLHNLLLPFLRRIKIPFWKQRKPFKFE